jgi:hypothetical protein
VGLRPPACWDRGFESHPGNGSLSVVSIVCSQHRSSSGCQLEVSASGWSLGQRSPTECGVSESDLEAAVLRKPWPTGAFCAMGGGKNCITETVQWPMTSNTVEGWMSVSPRVCHRRPTVSWQRAKPVIVGWFAGSTWKTTNGIPNGLYYLVTFMVDLHYVYIYKRGCGPHSTAGRAGGLGDLNFRLYSVEIVWRNGMDMVGRRRRKCCRNLLFLNLSRQSEYNYENRITVLCI